MTNFPRYVYPSNAGRTYVPRDPKLYSTPVYSNKYDHIHVDKLNSLYPFPAYRNKKSHEPFIVGPNIIIGPTTIVRGE